MKRISCKYCGQSIILDDLNNGYEYHCPRCESLVYRPGESKSTIVTMVFSALVVFFFAITQPLLNVKILHDTQVSILQSLELLFHSDILSGIILVFTIIIIPICMLVLILLIIFYKQIKLPIKYLKLFIKIYQFMRDWNMITVYFIGLLVSMVKITDISTMTILVGLWINALFVLLFYLTVIWFNPSDILYIPSKSSKDKNSIKKTVFFIILALIFLPAANLLPIMPIFKYAVYFPNTLLDGVISFYEEGDYFVSVVILISSIILPFIKLSGIIFMIIMVKYGIFLRYKKIVTKYYVLMSNIGKYSMIDVFVVVLASSFIQYDDLIRIEIGTAFIPFTLVVFFTVLANKSFDIKLIWKDR